MSSAENVKTGKKPKEIDIIDLILEDHHEVRKLYKSLQRDGEKKLEDIYQEMMWSIAKHAVAEEQVLYPLLENLGEEGKELAADSRKDHEKTKIAMGEIDGLPFDECADKVDDMLKDLIDHMEKEEKEDLKKVREMLEESDRQTAAKKFKMCKVLIPSGAKKLQYKTPFELVSAANEDITKIVYGEENETAESKEGEDSGYNLRSRGEQHKDEDFDSGKQRKAGDGKHEASKTRNSPSKGKGASESTSEKETNIGVHEGKRHTEEEDQPDSGSPSRKKLAVASEELETVGGKTQVNRQ